MGLAVAAVGVPLRSTVFTRAQPHQQMCVAVANSQSSAVVASLSLSVCCGLLLLSSVGLRALLQPPRTGLVVETHTATGDSSLCSASAHTPIRTNPSAMHTNKQLALLLLLAVAAALCMAAGDAAASAITQAKEQAAAADQVRPPTATTSTGPARCSLCFICSEHALRVPPTHLRLAACSIGCC